MCSKSFGFYVLYNINSIFNAILLIYELFSPFERTRFTFRWNVFYYCALKPLSRVHNYEKELN